MLKAMASLRIVHLPAPRSGSGLLVFLLAAFLLASPPPATSRPAAAVSVGLRQLSDSDSPPQSPVDPKSKTEIGSNAPEIPTATVETTTNGTCSCIGGCCCLLSMPDGNIITAPSCSPWTGVGVSSSSAATTAATA
ncbi:hypothetical protein Vafri_21273, partial [Volvox africanus]